jgi:hypothetical protein
MCHAVPQNPEKIKADLAERNRFGRFYYRCVLFAAFVLGGFQISSKSVNYQRVSCAWLACALHVSVEVLWQRLLFGRWLQVPRWREWRWRVPPPVHVEHHLICLTAFIGAAHSSICSFCACRFPGGESSSEAYGRVSFENPLIFFLAFNWQALWCCCLQVPWWRERQ